MGYLFEMHCHTKDVSRCGQCSAEEIVELYEGKGYDGFVITNHLNASTFISKKFGKADASWDEKIDYFMAGFHNFEKAAGDKYTVLLGLEICFYGDEYPNDYLVYGITEEFLRSHGDLMELSPKQFAKLAHENGFLFVQAHPFREGMRVENCSILDGYEIYNGNPRHNSNNPIAEAWAKHHNKTIVTAGSDFHEPEDTAHGGVIFKNEIKSNEDLVRELKAGNFEIMKIPFEQSK